MAKPRPASRAAHGAAGDQTRWAPRHPLRNDNGWNTQIADRFTSDGKYPVPRYEIAVVFIEVPGSAAPPPPTGADVRRMPYRINPHTYSQYIHM